MGDAVRLAAESLGISDVFLEYFDPFGSMYSLSMHYFKKDNNLFVVYGV